MFYRETSSWKVGAHVYIKSSFRLRLVLWTITLVFIVSAAVALVSTQSSWLFSVFVLAFIVWAWVFELARRSAYAQLYDNFQQRIKYYSKDYQYIRYRLFIAKLGGVPSAKVIENALRHVNGKIETESSSQIFAHPIMNICFGALLAVLGGAAGQWTRLEVKVAVVILLVVISSVYVFLGLFRTSPSDLKEFKRFLLWAQEDA